MATRKISKVNLRIKKGTKYNHVFHYRDRDPITNELTVIVPLTAYTIGRMQFRATVDAANPFLYEATTALAHIIIDGAAGDVSLAIPASVSAAFTFASAVYDLEVENGGDSDDVITIVRGSVTVEGEVTRP